MCEFINNNWTEIIVTFIGAFLGFGLALIFEYWKINSDKKKEKRNIEDEKSKKIEYYKILLEEVIKNSDEQKDLITEYIKEQSQDTLNPIPLKRISTNFFSRLKNIDARGIFEALADKFKSDKDWVQKYNNLNSYLDFLEGVLCEELIRINKNTLEKAYQDRLYIKNLIDEIPNILSKEAYYKAQKLGESRFEDDEYNFINNTIKKYHELVERRVQLEVFNVELLEPILQQINPFKAEDYALNIIFNCKNARVRMNDVRNDINQTISTYSEIIESMQKPIDKVQEMINKLSQS